MVTNGARDMQKRGHMDHGKNVYQATKVYAVYTNDKSNVISKPDKQSGKDFTVLRTM